MAIEQKTKCTWAKWAMTSPRSQTLGSAAFTQPEKKVALSNDFILEPVLKHSGVPAGRCHVNKRLNLLLGLLQKLVQLKSDWWL